MAGGDLAGIKQTDEVPRAHVEQGCGLRNGELAGQGHRSSSRPTAISRSPSVAQAALHAWKLRLIGPCPSKCHLREEPPADRLSFRHPVYFLDVATGVATRALHSQTALLLRARCAWARSWSLSTPSYGRLRVAWSQSCQRLITRGLVNRPLVRLPTLACRGVLAYWCGLAT
jgi:hypothetical protein